MIQVMPRKNVAPPPTIIYPTDESPPGTAPIIVPSPPKYIGVGPVEFVAIQTAPALTIVSSFWGALTLGWFANLLRKRAPGRMALLGGLLWCVVMLPFVALIIWRSGPGASGFALLLWVWPILHLLTTLMPERAPLPHYTRAIVNIKFGKYADAERAIIGELEKFENDFDGWLMLAELYAKQFNDVGEAERTVFELCDDPKTTVSQKSVALHKLADWQLQLRGDPIAARQALEEIVRRMPGTHLARMAQLRCRQLPTTKQEWDEQHARGRKLSMPALNDDLDETAKENVPETDPKEAEAAANRFVEKLKLDPNDVEAREKLARIFAERLGQAELGINQLELLLEMPEQPSNKMAEWIGLMAAWRLKYFDDREAAQKLLQRLIKEFPQSVQAFAAQRRLKLMEMGTR
jgi:tetratricopeptide (TPR) repeat protein